MMTTKTTAATENTYPYYDFMYRHLSIREWELRLVKDEYAFLQSCGGVTVNDMAYFRTSVMRYSMLPTVKNEKSEEAEEETNTTTIPASSIVSLKSMLLEIITTDQAFNINKICRHIRPLLDREGIRTYCRHHAIHVRSADLNRIVAVLQKEGIAPSSSMAASVDDIINGVM